MYYRLIWLNHRRVQCLQVLMVNHRPGQRLYRSHVSLLLFEPSLIFLCILIHLVFQLNIADEQHEFIFFVTSAHDLSLFVTECKRLKSSKRNSPEVGFRWLSYYIKRQLASCELHVLIYSIL